MCVIGVCACACVCLIVCACVGVYVCARDMCGKHKTSSLHPAIISGDNNYKGGGINDDGIRDGAHVDA